AALYLGEEPELSWARGSRCCRSAAPSSCRRTPPAATPAPTTPPANACWPPSRPGWRSRRIRWRTSPPRTCAPTTSPPCSPQPAPRSTRVPTGWCSPTAPTPSRRPRSCWRGTGTGTRRWWSPVRCARPATSAPTGRRTCGTRGGLPPRPLPGASAGSGPLAIVERDDLRLLQRPLPRAARIPGAPPDRLPAVPVLTAGLDEDLELLDHLPPEQLRGLVIAGVGMGHVSPAAMPRL